MIISASYRTDIPAFYGDWLRARLAAGYAMVRNPYSGKPSRVSLRSEEISGFVFWTRNARPIRDVFQNLAAAGVPFVIQYTVTGYPRDLEVGVPAADEAVREIRALADLFGPRAVVWRYDPVFYSSLTPPDFHRTQVKSLAGQLAGAVDEVTFSAAHIYRKTKRNTEESAERTGFTWSDPGTEEKAELLAALGSIAIEAGLAPTICAQPDLIRPPMQAARCIDAERLSDVAGRRLSARNKGNRPGCLCAESRDIGAYDSCPHGCVYCYAVERRTRAKTALKRHAPQGEYLLPD